MLIFISYTLCPLLLSGAQTYAQWWKISVWVPTGFACYSASKPQWHLADFCKCTYTCCACYSANYPKLIDKRLKLPMLWVTYICRARSCICRICHASPARGDTTDSVSYTHLDVYKRQLVYCRELIVFPPVYDAFRRYMLHVHLHLLPDVLRSLVWLWPVSYTHLDVYKRQLPRSSLFSFLLHNRCHGVLFVHVKVHKQHQNAAERPINCKRGIIR